MHYRYLLVAHFLLVNVLATGDGHGPGWEYPDIQAGPEAGELVE